MSQPIDLPTLDPALLADPVVRRWWEAARFPLAGLAYFPLYVLGILTAFRAEARALGAVGLTPEGAPDRWQAASAGAIRSIDALYMQARAMAVEIEGELDQAALLAPASEPLARARAAVREHLDSGWPRLMAAMQQARRAVQTHDDRAITLTGWHEHDRLSLALPDD